MSLLENNNKNISILIPLYNGVEFLNESLTSIINQTYIHWEVIIGINGHSLESNIIVEIYNIINNLNIDNKYDIRVIIYNTKGKSQTLNAMVNDVKFDYIALLDVDDIWVSYKLEKQVPLLSNYDVIGTQCVYFGDINIKPTVPTGDLSEHNFYSVNPLINSSIIIHKKDAYWDENEFIEDYDMWFRLYHNGKKFYNIPDILCLHRIHKQSNFNNSNDKYVEILKDKWRKLNSENNFVKK